MSEPLEPPAGARHRAVMLVLADGLTDARAYTVRACGHALRDVVAVVPLADHPTGDEARDVWQQQRDQAIYRRGREDALAEMRAAIGAHTAAIEHAVTAPIPTQAGPPDVEAVADGVAEELRRRADRARRPRRAKEDAVP